MEGNKACGEAVEMEDEFRILTLQIIGEAFLSLAPEESDRVGPLYNPTAIDEDHKLLCHLFSSGDAVPSLIIAQEILVCMHILPSGV